MLLTPSSFYIKTNRQNHSQRVDAIYRKIGSVYMKLKKKQLCTQPFLGDGVNQNLYKNISGSNRRNFKRH